MGEQRNERPSNPLGGPPESDGFLARPEALRRAQRLQTFGRVAGQIAHDLNNLLTSISGNLELLQADLPSAPRSQSLAREIQRAVARAADLTNQLIAFGRPPRPERQRVVDLNEVLAEAHLLVDRVLGEAVKLDLILSEHPLAIRVDPVDLDQALMNAVLNAKEAMPDGGMLTLLTDRVAAPPEDAPKPTSSGPYVRLRVRDSGTGLDPSLIPRIFEPFFTTRTGGPNPGLGLSVIQSLVADAGGFVAVHSEPGWGVTLDLYFPEAEPRAESPDSWLAEQYRGHGETILVVEDESVVQQVTRRVLERLGYRVLLAFQGAEAMRIAQEQSQPLDLLLTDVVLPHMNGVELAQRLRAQQPDLRVLFMSGHSMDAVDSPEATDLEHFLPKPFSPKRLAARVRRVLAEPPHRLPRTGAPS